MEIRPYRDTDQQAVIELWQRSELTRPWNDPAKDIERKSRVQKELFFVGLEGNRLVASAMGGYDGHRGWVYYLAVDPDSCKRGYGRQIMNHLEAELLKRGCAKINLQIREGNLEAVAFYESIGYQMDKVVSMGKRLIPDE